MIRLIQGDVYLYDGILEQDGAQRPGCRVTRQEGIEHTIAWPILMAHNTSGDGGVLRLKMDSLTSHDITYVGIVQTARASGLTEFPLPYVLTNCHNSLCAVGGTLNEDDHVFGLSAAKKYGGIFVPPHQSVIHSYAREVSAVSGGMIMGSDSHTRYGALGCMGIGEGGPELVKQLLGNTYDVPLPGIVGVYLTGSPVPGVGPQDVALAIIGAVYPNGFVKNKVMEFVGPGLQNLSVDFRNGIDVMTTETTCLSSVWATDDLVARYYAIHKRPQEYRPLAPGAVAVYDGMIVVDLSAIRPMIALPFHPSNVYSIEALNQNPGDILRETEKACQAQLDHPGLTIDLLSQLENGRIKATQGVIAGCSGGIYENILAAAAILDGKVVGSDFFSLSIYPASAPVNLALLENGTYTTLLKAGAIIRTAFCGPCFGAGDTPSHNGFSLRHSTRNFPNREGSRPNDGQIASVALMDARSIAATAVNGGYLTPATAVDMPAYATDYRYDDTPYRHSVVNCWKKADPSQELKLGPFIADWPGMLPLSDHLLLSVVSVIRDPVTTTDELIPSGETSTYRSNPLKLAEFTLSRKDPGYVGRAKAVYEAELSRRESHRLSSELSSFLQEQGLSEGDTAYVSAIFANSPGDGSAREQAASCQRVLGGGANIAYQYATKRYRSNLVNWGILPFTVDGEEPFPFAVGDLLLIKNIRQLVESGAEVVPAVTPNGNMVTLYLRDLSAEERDILLWGSLINHYGKAL